MKKILSLTFLIFALFTNNAFAENWYAGGTLHEANALTWQTATPENKLATCADFIAGVYSKELLAPEINRKIKSVNDFKPYASELAKQLDDAFTPESDPIQNKEIFTNQSVKSTAMMLMIMMKWVQD